jgi:phenylpropionate dioxygenase-like ring-hydroxylating dioxygenase large terminal subunit
MTTKTAHKSKLDNSRGPVLNDGTALKDLFEFDERSVSLRLLSDPEIYDLEMERLFTKVWIALAHESEVPKPGDFVVRQLGGDSVIVVRQKSGRIKVLLNACTHRGMELTRAESGNSTRLRCPYHGWVFDNEGHYMSAPCAEEMYGDIADKSEWSLKTARAELSGGMVWACWDPEAPTLADYLGDMKYYWDLMYERTESGMEAVGPPQRWVIPANWKAAAEQFAGDGYHVLTLHASLFEMGSFDVGDSSVLQGIDVSTPRGHGLLCRPLGNISTAMKGIRSEADAALDTLYKAPPAGLPVEAIERFADRYGPEAMSMMANCPPVIGQIFPNAAFMCTYILGAEGLAPDITIRTWNPLGPDKLEVLSWTLVERSASPELRGLTRRSTLQSFGSSGTIEQDDAEAWPSLTRVSRGVMGRQNWMRYPAAHEPSKPEGWPGEGLIYSGISKDDNQWNWWKSYYELLSDDSR